ncbi:SDR family oxidoreductase [Mobilitalea sibirica]|uniref:SDR family oxidoreductase n=1 Tax=Mobilitalea sibirica TaxID=1462919 RepID=A0A8J7H7C2_9FIRM|nr:SDR family oxidoreductase [Mobilitalea sibirica]MBH1939335.1 SDR family oxidoreductase [Mobilitalea sibirica]
MTNVKGKWALITGASRGVGYHIALFMAEHGCNLILHSRSISHTEKVIEEVKARGVKAYAVQAELSDINAVNRMLDEIEEKGTHVDILFNNAAVQIAYRQEYFKTPVEDFTQSFIINTIAPAMICYRLIPKMVQKGFGRVINTTSGIKDEPEQAGYSASKAALDKFTKDLGSRLEGSNVMINLADPGWCRTDLGGPHAPNSVESSIPGMCVGAFLDDKKSGRWISAQDFTGMTLEEAVKKAQSIEL